MQNNISNQEKILIDFYNKPVETWFKTKKISVPKSIKFYNQIISFLSERLNICNSKNNNFLRNIDYSYLELNEEFGINKLTEILYEIPKELIMNYYSICEEILYSYKKHLIQRQPTIRVHFQDNNCYQFYPFWHSDPILGHPPFEKNIWIPLTKPSKKNMHGFKIANPRISSEIFKTKCSFKPYESKKRKDVFRNKDFENESTLVDCNQGEGIIFDSRIFHSAVPFNETPRISIDIRIMDENFLNNPYPIFRGLGRKKIKFDSINFFISLDEINFLKKNN